MSAAEPAGVDQPTRETCSAASGEPRRLYGSVPDDWTACVAGMVVAIERLTTALHANHCHPDFEYWITTGGSPTPPGAWLGRGWEENPESPGHAKGVRPADTHWCWRRPRDPEGTPDAPA